MSGKDARPSPPSCFKPGVQQGVDCAIAEFHLGKKKKNKSACGIASPIEMKSLEEFIDNKSSLLI